MFTLYDMTVRPIVIYGTPVLHQPTAIVTEPIDTLRELIDDMFETMEKAHGVGLAANQIGVGKRIFVYNGSDDEGCLSLPGLSFPTGRATWAKVTGLNENGEEVSEEGTGFLARCFQHEVGHLDGFVYADVLQGRWKRAGKKAIKREGWTPDAGLTWMPGVDPDPFGHDDV